MKFLSLFLLFVLSIGSASATVYILDQNVTAPAGVYNDFASALAAAANEDTILVIPSTASYGNINITKPITLIGVGFNPDMEIPITSKFGNITIYNTASGTRLIGLELINYLYLGNTSGAISDIIVENSKIYAINHSATIIGNLIIRQNVFITPSSVYQIYLTAANQSSILVTNNIFSSTVTNGFAYGPYVTTGGVTFDHNLFLGNGSQQYAFYLLSNCSVTNNIFYSRSTAAQSGYTNVSFKNNVSFGSTLPMTFPPAGTNVAAVGNLENVDPQFVNLPTNTNQFLYNLDPTHQNVALDNAATDGTDIGIYGGYAPYKNSGSVLPVVKLFSFPHNIKEGDNTQADIIVTGN